MIKKAKKKNIQTKDKFIFEYDYELGFSSVNDFINYYTKHQNSNQKKMLNVYYPCKPTKITFPNKQANAYMTFLFMLDLAKKDARSKKIIIHEETYD